MDEDKVPTPQSEPTCDPRTVRERTLAHMESLMMQLTTVGAGIALACGAQFQPQPRRPQVCDPAPPPAECHETPDSLLARGSMDPSAVWEDSDGRWSVRLALNTRGSISLAGLSSRDVKVTGATLPSFPSGPAKTPQHIDFVLWPAVNETQVTVELPVSCYRKAIPLKFRLDISRPPTERGFVPVTLVKSSVLQNSVVSLKLPATYTNSQVPADQLQLNADNSFSLKEAGQTYRGTFVANGSTLELAISGGTKTTATLQGNSLTDSNGQTWALRKQTEVAINLGDTIDQVVAAMGQPDRIAKVANKDIYVYKDLKITFVDGKVSDIQ